MHKLKKHTFSKDILTAAALILLLLIVTSLVPDHAVDPWGIVVPRKLARVIFALALIQFFSYLAMRWFGPRSGIMLSGFLGGLISSSSVFATLPRRVAKHPDLFFPALGALLLAMSASLLEAIGILALTAPPLFVPFGTPLAVMSAAAVLLALVLGRKGFVRDPSWQHTKPLDLKSVFKLALIIFIMLFVIGFINSWLGPRGSEIVAFFAGLFELHGVTFANAQLYTQQHLGRDRALTALMLAVVGSFVSKLALLWLLAGRGRFAIWSSASLLFVLIIGGLTSLFTN